MHSGTFWNILDVVEGCRKVDFQVLHEYWNILHTHSVTFWNILHAFLEHPVTFCMHSGTFLNIQEYS